MFVTLPDNSKALVRWEHHRSNDTRHKLDGTPSDNPDSTTCSIYTPDGKVLLFAQTVTRYYRDPFDKNKARKAALAHVLDLYYGGPEKQETRRRFWEQYYVMRGGKW
jgi:hypothetical protein